MATTSSVGGTYMGTSYEEYQNEQRVAKTQLGKNDFLNLLAAQMQYQDPLEPTKDSDFVAQLAQFSALEQMQAMSSSMAMMQAYDLVGKYVVAPNVIFEDGNVRTLEGVVNSVVFKDGEYFAQIGEAFVKVSKIAEVYDSNYITPENKLSDSAHLLGCTVKGYTVDENGDTIYDETKPIKNDKGEPVYDTTKPIKDEDGKPKLGEDGKPLYEPLYEVKATEGTVTGLGIKNGTVVAYVETADGSEAIVPVSLIFDIRKVSEAATIASALADAVAAGKAASDAEAAARAAEYNRQPEDTDPDVEKKTDPVYNDGLLTRDVGNTTTDDDDGGDTPPPSGNIIITQ